MERLQTPNAHAIFVIPSMNISIRAPKSITYRSSCYVVITGIARKVSLKAAAGISESDHYYHSTSTPQWTKATCSDKLSTEFLSTQIQPRGVVGHPRRCADVDVPLSEPSSSDITFGVCCHLLNIASHYTLPRTDTSQINVECSLFIEGFVPYGCLVRVRLY